MADEETTGMFLRHTLMGGVVNTGDLALAMARLLLSHHYQAEEVRQSEPLTATDGGSEWLIEGTPYRPRKDLGTHRAMVRIAKRDGRIINLEISMGMIVQPEALKMIEAAKQKKP